MRILLLTYSIVGQSNYLRANALAECLAGKGHDVTLLSASPRRPGGRRIERERIGEGTLRRACVGSWGSARRRNSGLSISEVLLRRTAMAGEGFDLIHGFGHRPTVSWVGPALARRRGIPYVADWCDLFSDGGIAAERTLAGRVTVGVIDRWLEPRALQRADAVTVICAALHRRARRLCGDVPVSLVRPGALPAAKAGSGRAVRQRLGIPTCAPVVIHVSQNHQDLEILRQALVVAAARRPDLHFLLVGPAFPLIEQAARRAELRGRVHFTGVVPHAEVPRLLAAADVALLPYPPATRNECRFPCSFAEYAGAGLPVVTQPTGDLADLADGQAALLVAGDGEAMAAGVDRILDDRELAARLADRARRLAREELSWSVGARRLLDLYALLTAARASSPLPAIP
jgi:glycosyltransferase involved in cell wall biosynthesis